jgi:integrase
VAARAERAKVDAGRDPIAERRAADDLARKRGTFAELAEEWYAAEVEHRLKHPEAVRRALDNYLIKKLGRTPVAEVRPADCARLLDDVRDKHPTTANDLLRHLKAIFAFGIRRHRVDGSPVAAFVAAKDAGGKEESRTRALSRVELGKLFAAIRKEPTFGGDNLLLVRLLLALCVRKGELFAAPWDEFDLDGKTDDGPVWHLPAKRSKTGAAQDIPLSPVVVSWLRTAKGTRGRFRMGVPGATTGQARQVQARRHGHAERGAGPREARSRAVHDPRLPAHGPHAVGRTRRGTARRGSVPEPQAERRGRRLQPAQLLRGTTRRAAIVVGPAGAD